MDANKVAAIFQNKLHLEQALAGLHQAGFTPEEVSLLLKQPEADAEFVHETNLLVHTVAPPVIVETTPAVRVQESEAEPYAEFYDPVTMSVPVSEEEALSPEALDEEPYPPELAITEDADVPVVETVVMSDAP